MSAAVINLADHRAAQEPPWYEALPFIKPLGRRGGGLDCWAVDGVVTGDYERDCERGRDIGRLFVSYLWRDGVTNADMTILGTVAAAIARKGEDFAPGIRVGFCKALSAALVGAQFYDEPTG